MPRIHWVARGTGTPKDSDEVNRRKVARWKKENYSSRRGARGTQPLATTETHVSKCMMTTTCCGAQKSGVGKYCVLVPL